VIRKALNGAIAIFASLVFLWLIGGVSQAFELAPELQSALGSSRSDEELSVVVTLKNEIEPALFTDSDKTVRRHHLVRALKDQAELKLKPLQDLLENRGVKSIKSLWIINGLAIKATPGVVRELAHQLGVENVKLDYVIHAPAATTGTPVTPEWNINAIHAPQLWKLGYKGKGVVVANMDTGVDLKHPDLKNRWRGGKHSWFDPNGEHKTPYDADGHGTQTMSLMVGGSAGGTAIGVAPNAKWIAVKIYNDQGTATASVIHQGFQWLLDPDGNQTTDDAPDVVNNSWGLEEFRGGCLLEFQNDVQALRAAGIAVVFSGGNSGPNPATSISPANYPESFSVGSIDEAHLVAYESSRGPSGCDNATYPNVVAPGENVRVADLTYGGMFPDSYNTVSGTSFAAPHLAGAIALLLNARPKARIADIESSLKHTAHDLGAKGPDNDYGYGLIDVATAYSRLSHDGSCSTNVILAALFKARYCKTGTLIVAATSKWKSNARLEVVGYGPMKWDSENQMWVLRVRNVATNPGMVTVEGVECTTQAEVLTIPSGCDARLPAGSQFSQETMN
jgi:serine protease AprX